jgi:ribosomal protein S18 acetylase RimI-like enzyme
VSDLLARGLRTAVATWEVYAAGTPGASVQRGDGFLAAVFPQGPELDVFNNALLRHPSALPVVEDAYRAAGVERYAVWVAGDDLEAVGLLERRRYRLDTTTAAMGIELAGPVPAPGFEAGASTWAEYADAFLGGLLAGIDARGFRVVTGLLDGEPVAAAVGFEHQGDLGVFNVETKEHARRRGLATALTAYLVNRAVDDGFTTVTLQATPMAQRLYAACGFRTVARILEYVPGGPSGS